MLPKSGVYVCHFVKCKISWYCHTVKKFRLVSGVNASSGGAWVKFHPVSYTSFGFTPSPVKKC